jgi:membrane fusion protein (multidrug efflux system)
MSPAGKKISATAFVVLAATGFLVLRRTDSNLPDPHKASKKGPIAVSTIRLEAHAMEDNIFATGTLRANEELDLSSEIAGRITAINFKEGTAVRQGQVLVKLNDSDLRALLQKLQLQRSLAEREEKRAKLLLEQKLISLEDYDAKLNAVQILAADIDKTRSDLAKTELHAPFNGVVGLRSVSVGSTITPATAIAHIEQLSPIKIDFSLPEKYANTLKVGSPITFVVTGSDREYTGTVYAFEPKIDPATRTLKVRATAPNADGSLTPGAFAKIRVTLSRTDDALIVPTSAIVPTIDGQSVYVMNSGKALSRKVVTGIRTDSTIQVVSGLAPGDSIITTGVMQLRAGMPVKAAN